MLDEEIIIARYQKDLARRRDYVKKRYHTDESYREICKDKNRVRYRKQANERAVKKAAILCLQNESLHKVFMEELFCNGAFKKV